MTKTINNQSICEHALLLDADCADSRQFIDHIQQSGYGLYVFHRFHWEDVKRNVDYSDGELGTPDNNQSAEYWALRHCGASRFVYRLIPLATRPPEWTADRMWSVRSQKFDVTCYYDSLTRLEAEVTAGEECNWPVSLAEIRAS